MHGTWDDKHTIVLKYQTRDGGAGVDIVTPLVTARRSAVLVDRGWMSTENSGASRPKLPPVTDGQVTVTGWVRRDATGGAARVSELSTRAISSARDRRRCCPTRSTAASSTSPPRALRPRRRSVPSELPDDTSNGPHFFYGLQWWFFGALAVFGFCYLVWDELRQRRVRRAKDSRSERPQHAAVDGQHRRR